MRLPRTLRIPREPDFFIGGRENPYMRRWWVIPRNRFFNIYLHNILRSDDDRALHDHPWWSISIILRGGYIEHTPEGTFVRRMGWIRFRKATARHRLQLRDHYSKAHWIDNPAEIGGTIGGRIWHVPLRPAWTLFITGRRVRDWGFHCPKGWVPWQQFTDPTDSGKIGKGCGE